MYKIDNVLFKQLQILNNELTNIKKTSEYNEKIIILYEAIFDIYLKVSYNPTKIDLENFLIYHTVIKKSHTSYTFRNIIGIAKLFKRKGIKEFPKLLHIKSFNKLKSQNQDLLYSTYQEEEVITCWNLAIETSIKNNRDVTKELINTIVEECIKIEFDLNYQNNNNDNSNNGNNDLNPYKENTFDFTKEFPNSLSFSIKTKLSLLPTWLEQSKELNNLYIEYKSLKNKDKNKEKSIYKKQLWLDICESSYYVFLNKGEPLRREFYMDFLQDYIGVTSQKIRQYIRDTVSIMYILNEKGLKQINTGTWIRSFTQLRSKSINDNYYSLCCYNKQAVIECWSIILKRYEENEEKISTIKIENIIKEYLQKQNKQIDSQKRKFIEEENKQNIQDEVINVDLPSLKRNKTTDSISKETIEEEEEGQQESFTNNVEITTTTDYINVTSNFEEELNINFDINQYINFCNEEWLNQKEEEEEQRFDFWKDIPIDFNLIK